MAAIAPIVPVSHGWRRAWPAAAVVVAFALIYVLGLHRYLSLEAVAEHRDGLKTFVAAHLSWAILIFAAIYVLAVALSLPGATLLTITGGFLFGWMLGAPVSILAATLGAWIIFEIVKTSFGAALAERSGPAVKKLADGFNQDAFNYLLFLRLTPVFPFFVVNAVAGLCNVKRATFVIATLVGIIPGGFAYAYLGSGLDSVIDAQLAAQADCVAKQGGQPCAFSIDASALVTRELVIAFAALGAVSLIPVLLRKFRSP